MQRKQVGWSQAWGQEQAWGTECLTLTFAIVRKICRSGDHHQGAARLSSGHLCSHGEPQLVWGCGHACLGIKRRLQRHCYTAHLQHGHQCEDQRAGRRAWGRGRSQATCSLSSLNLPGSLRAGEVPQTCWGAEDWLAKQANSSPTLILSDHR